jgi:iron(III) transport system permease protein
VTALLETIAPSAPPAPVPARPSKRPPWTRTAGLGRAIGLPVVWIVAAFLLLAPVGCFLVIAFSPRLFDQGTQWFTLTNFASALGGSNLQGLVNSLLVGVTSAILALAMGFPIAWMLSRTDLTGRAIFGAAMWLVLLLPSWLPALGWERLAAPGGVLVQFGIPDGVLQHLIFGPFGVILLLALKGVPFVYLAITAALSGLGQEFEDAARVHGATRWGAVRMVSPILAPAILSALAIVFAESVSDFGVASTLAFNAHFPLATYTLFTSINDFPANFPVASAIGWLLVASVVVPLALQAKALRGRSYAVLSGRTRPAVRRQLTPRGRTLGILMVGGFYAIALGVPAIGAVSSSLLTNFGGAIGVHSLTWANYAQVFSGSGLAAPLLRSMVFGLVTATVTVVAGLVVARLLVGSRATKSARSLDFLLLAAVALPGTVFAAGYVFAYNLPFLSNIGIALYGTTTLLVIAYIASSLPTNARVLVGAVAQVQDNLVDAGRTHGVGILRSWFRGVLPVLSRPLVMAWLLTFCGIFLELPVSQILYAPGQPPASVAINDNLSNYHFGVGMAQSVVAVVIALAMVGLVLLVYRVLAPRGWRRIGGANG